jgi:hypothetical protein
VMTKAFRAAFQRVIQRLRPFPVGSRLMIAGYSPPHTSANSKSRSRSARCRPA